MKALLNYTLQLADNALINGHRISEWCGHGPILEQDIALINTSLDHLGQARSLYQYAAELFNQIPASEREALFTSPSLLSKETIDEDALPYLRDAWDYKNVLLVETPNEDWAYTIARSFFYDHFTTLLYKSLLTSKDETIAAIAEKSLKEVTYHKKWSSEWVIRLGDGTEESKQKMQEAINERWPYVHELFMISEVDQWALEAGIGVDLSQIAEEWHRNVANIIAEATLELPTEKWGHRGGKEGVHTEYLGYILADMQFLQRAYPNMEW